MSYEHQCYDQRLRTRKLWLNLSTPCAIYDALGINSLIHKMQIISVLTPSSVVMSLGSLGNKKTRVVLRYRIRAILLLLAWARVQVWIAQFKNGCAGQIIISESKTYSTMLPLTVTPLTRTCCWEALNYHTLFMPLWALSSVFPCWEDKRIQSLLDILVFWFPHSCSWRPSLLAMISWIIHLITKMNSVFH